MIFISVLFPAPFSPTRPWISPANSAKIDAPKRLDAAEGFGDPSQFEDG
jgi:hypothetical protein